MAGQACLKQGLRLFTGSQAVHPEAHFLQRLDGPGQVGHLADGEMFHRTGRCSVDNVGNPAAAIFGDHHALATGRIGVAQNRPQVVRVGNPVQKKEEPVLTGDLPISQEILELGVGKGLHTHHHSLVMRQPGKPVEILSTALPNRDVKLLRQSQDLIDAFAACFFVDKQFNRPAAAA